MEEETPKTLGEIVDELTAPYSPEPHELVLDVIVLMRIHDSVDRSNYLMYVGSEDMDMMTKRGMLEIAKEQMRYTHINERDDDE